MHEVDMNRDGTLAFSEFVELMDNLGTVQGTSEEKEENQLKAAFKIFNRSGGGYINSIDLRSVLNSLGEYLTNQESELSFDRGWDRGLVKNNPVYRPRGGDQISFGKKIFLSL